MNNLPDNCDSCDICLVINGDQAGIEIMLGKPDVLKIVKSPVRRIPKLVKLALLKFLDDEWEELFMHYLYEPYTMFVPSMIITSEGIVKVLKNWGRIDSLEDFKSYLWWDASWSDKHGTMVHFLISLFKFKQCACFLYTGCLFNVNLK